MWLAANLNLRKNIQLYRDFGNFVRARDRTLGEGEYSAVKLNPTRAAGLFGAIAVFSLIASACGGGGSTDKNA